MNDRALAAPFRDAGLPGQVQRMRDEESVPPLLPLRIDLAAAERTAAEVRQVLDAVPPGHDPVVTRQWLGAVEHLLSRAGEQDRAKLLQARAEVRSAGDPHGRGRPAEAVLADAATAGELFEQMGQPLPAATNFAAAASAAAQTGRIPLALETTVRALVALGDVPSGGGAGQAEVDVEADLAVRLGALCRQFLDYPRAQRFYELALTATETTGGDGRWGPVMTAIADVLLARVHDLPADAEERVALLTRAEELARRLSRRDSPEVFRTVHGPRLLADVLCERGDPVLAGEMLAGIPGRLPDHLAGPVHLSVGRCLMLLGRPAEAVTRFDRALAVLTADPALADPRADPLLADPPADRQTDRRAERRADRRADRRAERRAGGRHLGEAHLAERLTGLRLRSLARQSAGDLAGALADARSIADLLWHRHQSQVGSFMDQLWSRAGAEGECRDLEAQAQALLVTAQQDPLTGLANRRAVERFCTALHPGSGVSLVLIDVDHFKAVNDRFGHAVGDDVLCEMATLLSRSVRAMDVVARWGGEEFLVALPGGSGRLGEDAAARVCRRVRDHPWHQLAAGLTVTVSAGVASGTAAEVESVLERADQALYAAKESGRDRAEAR